MPPQSVRVVADPWFIPLADQSVSIPGYHFTMDKHYWYAWFFSSKPEFPVHSNIILLKQFANHK